MKWNSYSKNTYTTIKDSDDDHDHILQDPENNLFSCGGCSRLNMRLLAFISFTLASLFIVNSVMSSMPIEDTNKIKLYATSLTG